MYKPVYLLSEINDVEFFSFFLNPNPLHLYCHCALGLSNKRVTYLHLVGEGVLGYEENGRAEQN